MAAENFGKDPLSCRSCTRPASYSCAVCGKQFCHELSGCTETLSAHACTDVESSTPRRHHGAGNKAESIPGPG